jgi:hypothetical protein
MKKSVITITAPIFVAPVGLIAFTLSRTPVNPGKSPRALSALAKEEQLEQPAAQPQQRTTVTKYFEADGRQYKVTQITEEGRGKLTVEITELADGRANKRVVEAPNEQVLAKNEPELYRIINQNEAGAAVVQQMQVFGGDGGLVQSRVVVRGGGGGVAMMNIGGGLFGGGPVAPAPNLPPPPTDTGLNLLDNFGAKFNETADGVRVIDVKPGSAAAACGLQGGDVVNKISGRQINTQDDVKDALEKRDPAKPLLLEITRKGETLTLTVPDK